MAVSWNSPDGMANDPDNRVAPGQRHDLGQLFGSLFGQAQPNPAQGMANMNTATPMADPVLPMGQQELPYSNFTYDEALRDWDQGRFGAFMNQAGARLGPDAGYNETSALAEQLAEAARQERDFNFQQSDIQGGRGNIIPEIDPATDSIDPATDPIDAVGLLTGTPSQDVGQTMVGGMVPTRGDGTQRKSDVQRVIDSSPSVIDRSPLLSMLRSTGIAKEGDIYRIDGPDVGKGWNDIISGNLNFAQAGVDLSRWLRDLLRGDDAPVTGTIRPEAPVQSDVIPPKGAPGDFDTRVPEPRNTQGPEVGATKMPARQRQSSPRMTPQEINRRLDPKSYKDGFILNEDGTWTIRPQGRIDELDLSDLLVQALMQSYNYVR
tara:strand:+ start:1211 stop:2341 length:1131 start_codon:yes stop_codon:yes gene_type:complete